MDVGLFLPHHGLLTRDNENNYLQTVPMDQFDPVGLAQHAERLGFDYLCFGDHIVMSRDTSQSYPANPGSGVRSYPERPNVLDTVVLMSAIAAATTTIQLASSVLIAPYRHPLSDAKQYATIDIVSGGRLIFGVGPGWMKEEFDALGVSYADRGAITEECIEIYRLAWTQPWLSHKGRFFEFNDVTMEPKPVQKPCPPIIYGGGTAAGARRAARLCDGFYPLFLDPQADPGRCDGLLDVIRFEADAAGRDLGSFRLMAFVSAQMLGVPGPIGPNGKRPICTGTAEQVLEDMWEFGRRGYRSCSLHLDVPSGSIAEMTEMMERISADLLPDARAMTPLAFA